MIRKALVIIFALVVLGELWDRLFTSPDPEQAALNAAQQTESAVVKRARESCRQYILERAHEPGSVSFHQGTLSSRLPNGNRVIGLDFEAMSLGGLKTENGASCHIGPDGRVAELWLNGNRQH